MTEPITPPGKRLQGSQSHKAILPSSVLLKGFHAHVVQELPMILDVIQPSAMKGLVRIGPLVGEWFLEVADFC